MTLLGPSTEGEAKKFEALAKAKGPFRATYKGPWGAKSNLYDIGDAKKWYKNERPPHIEHGPTADVVVDAGKAYIRPTR